MASNKVGLPRESVCPVCSNVFIQPAKGRRQVYCSHECCAKNWLIHNRDKRKATIQRYESKPENKRKKYLKEKSRKLQQKYGWTLSNVESQLIRQGFRCYGCLQKIDAFTARIDHNHVTGKVRGLLCDSCNWCVGHAKESATTMRRLMAYLERDPNKYLVYLIGTLKNKRIPEIGNLLRNEGYDVMDEWWTPGEQADENWQRYEQIRGRTYRDALMGRAATNIYLFDRAYLDLSDAAIVVMPAGRSAAIELGYAKGSGKYTGIFLDDVEPERYDVMPNFFVDNLFKTKEELIAGLETRFPKLDTDYRKGN